MIPVAVALMTPIPLLMGFIIKKCFGKKKDQSAENPADPAAESMLKNESNVASTRPKNENENA